MNDKNFIEELRQKREEYGVTQQGLLLPVVSAVNITTALKKENSH